MNISVAELKTNRLELRAYNVGDEISLFQEYCGDIEVSKYLQRLVHITVSQTQQMLQKWALSYWQQPSQGFSWVIAERKSHLAIGLLTIIQQQNNSFEIHFGLGPRFQGQGYMLEAMKAVIQYFRQYLTLKSLDTFCDAEHIKAYQVLLKTGFEIVERINAYTLLPKLGTEKRDVLVFQYRLDHHDEN
ncbi:GNAT family N-acetyltransferase [Acinetobacter sp. NPDC052428]|jgi:ribosomal-protein-alanine N-acetyltransferase|uniref:GNAT family N-acetyltransferase n=1 Tax=Acinetobacter sp. NPDC052428 TaxID=3363890 RepID=UPI0037C9FDD3